MLVTEATRCGSAAASWVMSDPPFEWPITGIGALETESKTARASTRSQSHW